MAGKPPYYVRETLIDLATAYVAYGFALSYFPLSMGGRAVDRSSIAFNGPMNCLLVSPSVTGSFHKFIIFSHARICSMVLSYVFELFE